MILTNCIVTAYCSCHLCCGSHSTLGLTASGVKPVQGVTVAASRRIPLGTHIVIEGHEYIVQDRLARKYDNRVDIYFSSHKDALKYGLQHHNVIIK